MTAIEKGLITILCCDALFAALALPLALRMVPPNIIYGFRIRATLTDDDLWYEANAHFGRGLLMASVISAVAVTILYCMRLEPQLFLPLSVAALIAPVAAATVATAASLRRLRSKR